jgi:ribonuclease P protein component
VQDCELLSADAPERSVKEPAARAGTGFPRAARLLKHADFERVYKQGQRLFSPHLTVFYLRRAESVVTGTSAAENGARVGFTVGRVLGGAVERNRIKRRMREAVRMRRSALSSAGSVDVVMNPKKSVLTAEFAVVLDEVGRALDGIAKRLLQKKEPAQKQQEPSLNHK